MSALSMNTARLIIVVVAIILYSTDVERTAYTALLLTSSVVVLQCFSLGNR